MAIFNSFFYVYQRVTIMWKRETQFLAPAMSDSSTEGQTPHAHHLRFDFLAPLEFSRWNICEKTCCKNRKTSPMVYKSEILKSYVYEMLIYWLCMFMNVYDITHN